MRASPSFLLILLAACSSSDEPVAPSTAPAPAPAPAPAKPDDGAGELARKPKQRITVASLGLALEVPEGTTVTPPRDAADGAHRANLRQGAFMVNLSAVDEFSTPNLAAAKQLSTSDKLVAWIRADPTPTGWILFKEIDSGMYKEHRFEAEVRAEVAGKKWDCSVSAPSKPLAELALEACLTVASTSPPSAPAIATKPTKASTPAARLAKPAGVARVRGAATTVQGSLAPDVIKRVIQASTARMRLCYERTQPAPAVKVTAHFVIGRDGAVSTISTSGGSPTLSACVTGVFRGLRFPAPAEPVKVSYPLSFQPS